MTKKVIQINKNPVFDIGMISTVFSKDTEFYGDLSFKKSLLVISRLVLHKRAVYRTHQAVQITMVS